MTEKILIVGGVAGGMSAATRLRRLNENAEIIVFEKGPYVSFANCGLPYYVGVEFYSNQILTILCEIDDLELLYSIDLLDYNKKKGTPIGDHIDRVGQIFYEAA